MKAPPKGENDLIMHLSVEVCMESYFLASKERSVGEWTETFHGTDSDGNDVTYADDGKGGAYLADGHVSRDAFFGTDSSGNKGHDHYNNKGGGTSRGKYNG